MHKSPSKQSKHPMWSSTSDSQTDQMPILNQPESAFCTHTDSFKICASHFHAFLPLSYCGGPTMGIPHTDPLNALCDLLWCLVTKRNRRRISKPRPNALYKLWINLYSQFSVSSLFVCFSHHFFWPNFCSLCCYFTTGRLNAFVAISVFTISTAFATGILRYVPLNATLTTCLQPLALNFDRLPASTATLLRSFQPSHCLTLRFFNLLNVIHNSSPNNVLHNLIPTVRTTLAPLTVRPRCCSSPHSFLTN